jgi:hypothetical protein
MKPVKRLFLKLVYTIFAQIMKKLSLIFALCAVAAATMAQRAPSLKGRPNIPGTFQIDLGVNRLTERPNDIKIGFWGSRSLTLYYFRDIQIAKSKFSIHPGIGFSFERYKFIDFEKRWSTDTVRRNTPTLVLNDQGNTIFQQSARVLYGAADTLSAIRKSMLVTNYLDIPLEFRFSTNPYDPARSFKVSVGGRVGVLVSSHTKLKFNDDGDTKKLKDKQNFNLNPFRYSAILRIGVGNFNWFAHYNLNKLFEADKGPDRTQASTYTIGVSLAGF